MRVSALSVYGEGSFEGVVHLVGSGRSYGKYGAYEAAYAQTTIHVLPSSPYCLTSLSEFLKDEGIV